MGVQPESRFAAEIYRDRMERAVQQMRAAHVDALLITPGPDLRYLVGSAMDSFERLTCLVVPADKDTPTVVVPQLELAALADSAVQELGLRVRPWTDGTDPYQLVAATLHAGSRLAVSDYMPALHALPLARISGSIPVSATPILRELRMVKDPAEIEALRRAGAAIDRVHARMAEWLVPGRTEAAVAADIERALLAEGHTEAAFIVVGSGPHGADPHHAVSDRQLVQGDVVVVDIGGPVAPGYYSDCTRTYALGDPGEVVRSRYEVLEQAQADAVAAVRPGATAAAVDAAARDGIAAAGFGAEFIHRTGHGIGLSVHEEPYIMAGNDTVLRPGMTFSVEPGIYFPGQWGARIEDIVVVTDDGVESLNQRPHGLTVLSEPGGADRS